MQSQDSFSSSRPNSRSVINCKNISSNNRKSMKIEILSKTQDNINFLTDKLNELENYTSKIKQQKSSFIENSEKNNIKLTKLMKNKQTDDYETFQINKNAFSPRKNLQNSVKLKSDSVLKNIKQIKSINSQNNINSFLTSADSKHSNNIDDFDIQLTRENTKKSEPMVSLREAIEGSAIEHIKGKIKTDTISQLKPIQNNHELGAMNVASEKLKKSVSTDKLKLTNSLKTQMLVCKDLCIGSDQQTTKVLGSYNQSMRNLKEISKTYSDTLSPRNVTNMLSKNRVANQFTPDALSNLQSIKAKSKGSMTILKTEDTTNKFSVSSNKLNKISDMNKEGLNNFRINVLRDLNSKHKEGIHDISNFFLKHCKEKLILQNILGFFVENYNFDILKIASKYSNSEFPTQFISRLMTVFANSKDDFKIDIIKFTQTIFLHTLDLNIIEREIPLLIENLPTKDQDCFNAKLKLNVVATHSATINNKQNKSILDKLKNLNQRDNIKFQDGQCNLILRDNIKIEFRQKQTSNIEMQSKQIEQDEANQDLESIQSDDSRAFTQVDFNQEIKQQTNQMKTEYKRNISNVKRQITGQIKIEDKAQNIFLKCKSWNNNLNTAQFEGYVQSINDNSRSPIARTTADKFKQNKFIDTSNYKIDKDDILADFDLSLNDIDFAIEPARIRHTFSNMMQIDFQTYELMQLTNKVIDESIYTCEPLTRKFITKKLMKNSNSNKEEEKELSIKSIISDYLNQFHSQREQNDSELMKNFRSKIQLGMNQGNVNLTTDDLMMVKKFENQEHDNEELRKIIREIEQITGEKLQTIQ